MHAALMFCYIPQWFVKIQVNLSFLWRTLITYSLCLSNAIEAVSGNAITHTTSITDWKRKITRNVLDRETIDFFLEADHAAESYNWAAIADHSRKINLMRINRLLLDIGVLWAVDESHSGITKRRAATTQHGLLVRAVWWRPAAAGSQRKCVDHPRRSCTNWRARLVDRHDGPAAAATGKHQGIQMGWTR